MGKTIKQYRSHKFNLCGLNLHYCFAILPTKKLHGLDLLFSLLQELSVGLRFLIRCMVTSRAGWMCDISSLQPAWATWAVENSPMFKLIDARSTIYIKLNFMNIIFNSSKIV